MTELNRWIRVAAVGAVVPLAACGDLLSVEAPGRISDEDLNTLNAFPALVAGMAWDLTNAYDATVLYTSTIASGELWHSGSYAITEEARGILVPEDMNGEWASMQQARWVAENGIERMRAVFEDAGRGDAFARSPLVAKAYLYAGLSNRLLGESVCSTAIDGGAEQPHTVHFSRAQEHFTRAIEIGQAAGSSEVVDAARAGRASVRAWQGDWAGAVTDAEAVPVDHVFEVIFNQENANDLWIETHARPEFTVWNTPLQAAPDDPRAPWIVVLLANGDTATGANGATPFFRQLKYAETGADVAATKGTEMLVLRAEAALRDNDIQGAFALLNEAREFHDMDALAAPTSIEAAWDVLQSERLATLWLEGRHFWDVRRFFEAGPSSPMYNPFLEGRDTCFPISENERRSNPNLGL